MSECDLRNAISVDVPRCAVDGVGNIPNDHVTLPSRVFEPDEFLHSAGNRDQIRLAVVIEVRNNDLIATAQISGDCVLYEPGRGSCAVSRARAKEIDRNKTGSNSN